MRTADQFLFGYHDGHRLLCGSRALSSDTAVALLGATDPALGEDGAPLVTGLALTEAREFALCVSWSAPEIPRPGAVWAHALIVEEATLSAPHALDVLLGLPRRPAGDGRDLDSYRTPIALDGVAPAAASYLPPQPVDRELVGRLVRAAYDPAVDRTVAEAELPAAATGLVALWRAQWPQMRARFSFRTRDSVREGRVGLRRDGRATDPQRQRR